MKFKIMTGIVSILLFTGCSQMLDNIIVAKKSEPKWLNNPYIENDDYAAVGCANEHFDGKEAQKKLAISRAIDQLATSKRVKVQKVKLMKKSVSGSISSSSMKSSSLHSVDNVSVSTKTKAIYTKKSGEMCAWVILR
ncbi:MAG: hypothetical protein U9O56_06600 [Campylobacterota bacterium]|nr:hypothetical protein [Campylobacterota bacterium]